LIRTGRASDGSMGTGGRLYRRVRAGVFDRPTGFAWVEPGKLAASGYPASRGQLEWLAQSGIRSVLTLTEADVPSEWKQGLDLRSKHVSLRDHELPDSEKLDEGVDFIVQELSAGRSVVVHCLAGEGRTGCMLAAYLIREKGIGPQQALDELRRVKPAFVERSQESAVFEYARRHGQLAAS